MQIAGSRSTSRYRRDPRLLHCDPAGAIHFYEFRGKKVLIALIQTLYSVPTVVVGS